MVLDIIAAVLTYAAVGVGAWFIGGYMVKVFKGERVWLSRVIAPVSVSPTGSSVSTRTTSRAGSHTSSRFSR